MVGEKGKKRGFEGVKRKKCIFLKKSCKKIWWIQKSVLPLQCLSLVVH